MLWANYSTPQVSIALSTVILSIRPYMPPQRVDVKSETLADHHSEFIWLKLTGSRI